MPDLKLMLACWDYDRTRPLIDGRVRPEGIDLDIEVLRPRQAFQRMLDKKEFDVSELSLASYAALPPPQAGEGAEQACRSRWFY
jgi:4,5-dihydroxyphthalate decarboxylase